MTSLTDPPVALPYRLTLATSLVPYQSCLVDPGPSRAVHCPELNACLVNEKRSIHVDCQAVHFGYAVPVHVLPLQDRPQLAELVLDSEVLSPRLLDYLMATVRPRKYVEPDEDIAAIAKQISDHAEAIYQTWKSRGLAPAEILNCHSSAQAADKFGTSLKPEAPARRAGGKRPVSAEPPLANSFDLRSNGKRPVSAEPTLSNSFELRSSGKRPVSAEPHLANSFELRTSGKRPVSAEPPLANSFDLRSNGKRPVSADPPLNNSFELRSNGKRPVSADPPLSNSFELRSNGKRPVSADDQFVNNYERSETPSITANNLEQLVNNFVVEDKARLAARQTKSLPSSIQFALQKFEPKTLAMQETIETTFPVELNSRSVEDVRKNSAEYMAEVALEEERLINALKTGVVIAEEKAKKKKKDPVDNLSLVDYAKVRYRAAQQTPLTQQRLDDSKAFEALGADTHGRHIDAAKVKFERPKSTGVPHPELTNQQRLRAAAHGSNPVRPFLTRGSVAERVLIFEKCPTELLKCSERSRSPAITTWRSGHHDVQTKAQSYTRDKELQAPQNKAHDGLPPNTTLQRHIKANRSNAGLHIPRFYFPRGKPQVESLDNVLAKITAAFAALPNQQAPRDKFSLITKACDCPLYWKIPLFNASGGLKLGYVDANTFIDFWKKLTSTCHDEAARFVYILTKGVRTFILPEDLMALVQDVVDTHPGLTFLKEAVEFHSRYVHTVIARIYYCTNRSWSGRISLAELRRSNLLHVLRVLELEDDINQVTAFFSYEHFYVIYCKFWELDRDHDLFIDKNDLRRHNDHALSSRMLDRIFSGAVTRHSQQLLDEKMSYTEFVWFLLSEEDKTHPTAVEYWFRCMDLDGDGYLSMYELEYFYEEQLQRLDAIGIETLPFQDCLCQMLDMIRPNVEGKISLSDLRRCKMTSIFFDTFFNLEKYLEHEQKDPFAAQRDHEDGGDASDWDRYAADEYEALVAEEGGVGEHNDDMGAYLDGDIDGDDIFSPNLDNLTTSDDDDEEVVKSTNWRKPSFKVTDFDGEEDDGDYAKDSDCSV